MQTLQIQWFDFVTLGHCSYLPYWWSQGPDNVAQPEAEYVNLAVADIIRIVNCAAEGLFSRIVWFYCISQVGHFCRKHCSTVTAELMNSVLGNVLKLIGNNIGARHAPWMTRIASKFSFLLNRRRNRIKNYFSLFWTSWFLHVNCVFAARTQPIIVNATTDMLTTDILPVAQKLKEQARNMAKEEEAFMQRKRTRHADGEDISSTQEVVCRFISFCFCCVVFAQLKSATGSADVSHTTLTHLSGQGLSCQISIGKESRLLLHCFSLFRFCNKQHVFVLAANRKVEQN